MSITQMVEAARELSYEERKELIKRLIDLPPESSPVIKKKRNILELAGLGAEIWEGIDPQEYIDELRNDWDHRP
jgi:hypothetical protein